MCEIGVIIALQVHHRVTAVHSSVYSTVVFLIIPVKTGESKVRKSGRGFNGKTVH